MKTLILGPTFTAATGAAPTDAADILGAWLANPACPFTGERTGQHFQIAMRPAERHRWSPWLTLEVCDLKDRARAEVFGRFNPSPAIWTGYILASLALLTTAFGALVWGAAQLLMHKPPHALWVIPVCFGVLIAMWLLSAAGQRLAADDMARMRAAVEDVVRPRE